MTLIVRRDTWLRMAHGRLSPFDALLSGRHAPRRRHGAGQARRSASERSDRPVRRALLGRLPPMPDTTGTITNIKLSSFLSGTVNAFDTCMVTLLDAGTGVSWLFFCGTPATTRRRWSGSARPNALRWRARPRSTSDQQCDGASFHRDRFQHRRRYPGRLHLTFLVAWRREFTIVRRHEL